MTDFTVIDIETTGSLPWRDQLLCVGLGPRVHKGTQGRAMAAMAMSRRGTTLVAHTNYDLRWLMLDGVKLAEGVSYHDTKVMAWMLDGTQALDLESLSLKYLEHLPPKPIKMQAGRVMFESRELGLVPIEDVPWYEMEDYNLSDITTEARLYVRLRDILKDEGKWEHFIREEAPFSRLLVECEAAGVPYSKREGAKLLGTTEESKAEVRARLVEATGIPDFNPGSGDQVAAFLYGELFEREVRFPIPRLAGLAPGAKTAVVAGLTPSGVRVTKIGRDYATGVMVVEGRGLRPLIY